jgi:hypothetical protein
VWVDKIPEKVLWWIKFFSVFLAGRSVTKEAVVDHTTAEALAVVSAAIFGKKRGCRQIIFRGDALRIVQAINDKSPRQSCYGNFVEGIQAEMHTLEQGASNYVAM